MAWFNYELSNPGNIDPADGFSFSYGNIPFGGLSNLAEKAGLATLP
jgi:hypothetical protein